MVTYRFWGLPHKIVFLHAYKPSILPILGRALDPQVLGLEVFFWLPGLSTFFYRLQEARWLSGQILHVVNEVLWTSARHKLGWTIPSLSTVSTVTLEKLIRLFGNASQRKKHKKKSTELQIKNVNDAMTMPAMMRLWLCGPHPGSKCLRPTPLLRSDSAGVVSGLRNESNIIQPCHTTSTTWCILSVRENAKDSVSKSFKICEEYCRFND